jgi:iron(III) transport system ATP-binding protein
MPDIQLSNIVKRYPRNADPAVNHVSLTVHDGEFLCVLGPSGCGKTTILRLISGLEQLSQGTIKIGGDVVDSVDDGFFVAPERRNLGLVFQSYALWPHMTIEKNIEFGLRLRNMANHERRRRVKEVMETLCIDGLGSRYPSQLSGGQQQRVALARMLAVNPSVLLLDEPLSNLDAALRLEMRSELSRLHREFGTTIVFVTHDQWEAMTLATRIAVMSKGKLQQVGTPDEIYGLPSNRFVAEFIGNPPINMISLESSVARHLTEGQTMKFTTGSGPASMSAMGIRPEGIMLSPGDGVSGKPAAQIGLPVVLRTVLPTGGAWILEIEHVSPEGTTSLYGVTHEPPSWQPEHNLLVHLRNEAIHFFDTKGQRVPHQSGSLR